MMVKNLTKDKNKKAQLNISFHFIFVLIGGLLFLIFFFLVIKAMVGSSEASDTRALTQGINSIIYNALPNTNSFDIARIPPDTSLYYTCDMYQGVVDSSFIGVNSQLPEDLVSDTAFKNIPLFMPSNVQGSRLFTWTIPWEAPFKITNLVLVTNNRTKYYFVRNDYSTKIDSFLKDLPAINYESISLGDVSLINDQFQNYRFVIFSNSLSPSSFNLPDSVKKKSTFVKVMPDNTNGFDSFKLEFFNSLGQSEGSQETYYGETLAYAAIFADNKTKFECDYFKAKQRMNLSLRIIKTRLAKITTNLPVDKKKCNEIYVLAEKKLLNLNLALTSQETLESYNRQLMARNCPLIY